MTPEARVPCRCQLLVRGQLFVRGRSRSEIAEKLKSLSFSVQPACILFPNLKINLMVSFSCEEDLLLTCSSSSDCAASGCDYGQNV